MKYLILFLMSFSAFGNYAKLSEVETNSISTVWMKKSKCENDCIKIPSGYDSNFHRAIDEMIDNPESPINSKNEIEVCADQADCDAKNIAKSCADELEVVYVAADFSEIYCSKLIGYNQMLSGRKIIVEDGSLKAAHLADKQAKKDAKQTEKDAIAILKTKIDADQDLTNAELRQVLKYLIK